jgi:hypothetical protein
MSLGVAGSGSSTSIHPTMRTTTAHEPRIRSLRRIGGDQRHRARTVRRAARDSSGSQPILSVWHRRTRRLRRTGSRLSSFAWPTTGLSRSPRFARSKCRRDRRACCRRVHPRASARSALWPPATWDSSHPALRRSLSSPSGPPTKATS